MTAQTVLDQKGSKVAATSSFMQGMTLELVHDPPRQGDVDPLGTGGIRHLTRAGGSGTLLEPLLQLKPQLLKN